MKKGNMIDLSIYRNLYNAKNTKSDPSISDELEAAIQNLIYRLRELGPIKN